MGHKPRPKMPLRDTYETTAEVMSAEIVEVVGCPGRA